MVRPRWRKVFRDLWLHQGRTALVVLAIVIGIVGAGSILDTWAFVRRVTREGYLATNPASATLRIAGLDQNLVVRVRAHPAVAAAEARRTVSAAIRVQGTWRTALLFVGDDLATSRIGLIQAEAGEWPPRDGGLVVERSSVEFAGLAVGEAVTLQRGDGPAVTLPVIGIARDAGLAPGWMEHLVYGFVTPATLTALGLTPELDQLLVTVRDRNAGRETIRKIAFELKALAEAAGHRVTDVEVPEPGRHIHAAQIDSLLYTKGGFALLTLFLSGFLVVNLIAAMLTGQVREIGVMKAIGASTGQVAGLYLGLALVLGLVASAIAIPAAAVIGRWYAQFIADLLNFDTAGFTIPRWTYLVQLAVGALLPVVAAAVPVWRGSRTTVAAAIRDVGIAPSGAGPGWLVRRVRGGSRPLVLSLRNAFRRRGRMALTLVTLATGGAVYLGAVNLRASIRDSVDILFGDVLRYDLSLRLADAYAPDSLERAVAGMPGVVRAEGWNGVRASVARPGGMLGNGFGIVGQPAGSEMISYPVVAGRWLRADDREALVVNTSLIDDDPEVRVGGTVTLVVAGRTVRWTVVGVIKSMPQPAAFATREAVAALTGDDRVRTAVVRLADGSPAAKATAARNLRSTLDRAGLGVASAQLLSESRLSTEDHLLMVAGFLLVMAQLMIVVGGLGLASTMSLAVLERTREIGVLRAIGARHRSILAMVQIEALVIGLLSWVVAIPLSMPMSVILARAFGRVMIPVPIRYFPGVEAVAGWLAVVVVASLAASAWPAWRATRVPTAAALAYE